MVYVAVCRAGVLVPLCPPTLSSCLARHVARLWQRVTWETHQTHSHSRTQLNPQREYCITQLRLHRLPLYYSPLTGPALDLETQGMSRQLLHRLSAALLAWITTHTATIKISLKSKRMSVAPRVYSWLCPSPSRTLTRRWRPVYITDRPTQGASIHNVNWKPSWKVF